MKTDTKVKHLDAFGEWVMEYAENICNLHNDFIKDQAQETAGNTKNKIKAKPVKEEDLPNIIEFAFSLYKETKHYPKKYAAKKVEMIQPSSVFGFKRKNR